MSSDKRLSRKLPEWVRREDSPGVRIDSGPFIGIIKNNNDPIRGGRLQVWIPDLGGDEDNSKNWRTVAYASPFYGTTYQGKSSKNNKFDEVIHSYGFWAVPPDVGNHVICTFIAGDPNRGYWFACVNPDLSHYMVPGLAAGNSTDVEHASDTLQKAYSRTGSAWPVTEFNQNDPKNIKDGWVNNPKPPHENQVAVLLEQGLDRDNIRGGITSSSQRETPSMVFGISTPGRPVNDPKDDLVFQQKLKAGTLTDEDLVIRSRKGGHTFVMDDGDQEGANQLMRMRTAGGHQILMSDSERVLYIANSDGTCWLEFTGGGHINVFSTGGMHIRTEGDLDIHADNDINIESGNEIKIRAGSSIEMQSKTVAAKGSKSLSFHGGRISSYSETSYAIQSGTASILTKGLTAIEGGKVTIEGGSNIIAHAGQIDLNGPTPDAVGEISPISDLTSYKQNDVTWDDQRGVWAKVAGAFETIVPTTPTHEPWIRGPSSEAIANNVGGTPQFSDVAETVKLNQKQSSICEPQTPVTTPGSSIPMNPNTYEQLVDAELKNYGIKDTTQLAAIMAQCSHESGDWKYLRELGKDDYFAKYEGRASLGNTQPGDGLKFKGRGFIQITGRDIYTRAGQYLKLDLVNNPALAEDPAIAAKLVIYFFFEYKKYFTRTINWADVTAVTRLVNGGLNGINDRKIKFEKYKQRYAEVSGGVVTSGDGSVVVDGSGNPIRSGATNTIDPGPESAKGKPVDNPAPPESMTRADTATPSAVDSGGTDIPGLSATQMKALMVQIGYAESSLDYNKVNTDKKQIGRYQINGTILKEYGYVTDENNILTSSSWTGKDGISSHQDWLTNTGTQETVMEQFLSDVYVKLCANRGIKAKDDICTAAGMMSVAYFFRASASSFFISSPHEKARYWREQGTQTNESGVSAVAPYNWGRYAIDVLSTVSLSTGLPAASTPAEGNAATVNIDPDSVLIFTTRSGDRAHFNATVTEFKNAILQAAKEYKERTGRKLTISSTVRTQEEQTAIYEGWTAAGGKMPDRPTVNVNPYGNISRPVKTVGNHGLGIAADIGVADAIAMEQMGILEKYGLYRFDPKGDPPHVQLKPDLRPSGLVTIQKLG